MIKYIAFLSVLFLTSMASWAVEPYQPVQPDPILESWRWRSFPELKGLGLECMAEGPDGNLWFGVDDGVRVYDGVKWTTYSVPGAPVRTLCATQNDRVYAGTDEGIYQFWAGEWKPVLPAIKDLIWPVYDLQEASDGSLWAAGRTGALHLNKNNKIFYTSKTLAPGFKALLSDVSISALPDGIPKPRPWPRAQRLGLVSTRMRDGSRFVLYVLPEGPADIAGLHMGDRITSVNGNPEIELRNLPAGISVTLTLHRSGRSDPLEINVTPVTTIEGSYPNSDIDDVYEDRSGDMWFGLYGDKQGGGGILHYDVQNAQWQTFTEEDGLKVMLRARIIQTQDGKIWVGDGDFETGISRYDGKSWTVVADNFGMNSVLETSDDVLWVGTGGSVTTFKDSSRKAYSRRNQDVPLPPVRIIQMLESSDGAVWFAGRGHEAVRLDYNTSRWTTYDNLNFQCETPNRIQWFVASDSSVVSFDGNNWQRYGVQDGLMDYPIALVITKKGDLWAAGSHKGTIAMARFNSGQWLNQTHVQTTAPARWVIVHEATDGALWINRREQGWGRRETIRYAPDVDPPETQIEVSLNRVAQPGNTVLSWTGSAPWKATPNPELQYAYRLNDESWSPFTFATHQPFFSLPSGDHTFQVKSRDRDLNEDLSPATMTFTVIPPVWQQLWFQGLMAALLGTIGFQTARVIRRDRHLQASNRELEVENALERVRAQALGMQKSEDLMDLSKSLLQEFEGLGYVMPFTGIRIWDEEKGTLETCTYRSYQESIPYNKATLSEWFESDQLTHSKKIFETWKQGHAYWIDEMVEEEVAKYYRLRNEHTPSESLRERMENPPNRRVQHNIYFASGCLILTMYDDQLSESDLSVAKRFADVFYMAYTRCKELQEKQEQNRQLEQTNQELTLEAALERVRVKALSMQKGGDLRAVSYALFDELSQLKISYHVLEIYDETRDVIEIWGGGTNRDSRTSEATTLIEIATSRGLPSRWASLKAMQEVDPHFNARREAKKRGDAFYTENRLLDEYVENARNRSHLFNVPDGSTQQDRWDNVEQAMRAQLPESWTFYFVFNTYGALRLLATESLTDQEIEIARRFSDLFAFAYSRFLDIAEREKRNRDLEIENALERVRAQALGMQESEDLSAVSSALLQEFAGLGFEMMHANINVWDEVQETAKNWYVGAVTGAHTPKQRTLSDFLENNVNRMGFEAWKEQRSYLVQELVGEEAVEHLSNMTKTGNLTDAEYQERLKILENTPDFRIVFHLVFFSCGFIRLGMVNNRLSESDLGVSKRFADVFDLAYARFVELQEKEEQNRQLEETNRAMSEANRELFQANKALQRDRTVARLRSEVQAMEQVSDFERVLSVLAEDLKSVGLSFDTCGIDVLDEPVDEPTMAYFENNGFQYSTYTIDPDGAVTLESYRVLAPFPPVNRENIERFIEGKPWQGRSEQTAIVEVPAASYGRLRITSSEREGFTEEDIDSLQDFASAIALGYTRYLDIREIQEQTQKKSAFLASMSHKLRTLMNAIKGFTSLVLRRIGDSIPKQHKENLEKVTQASDHLLAMINDLLDLSKIEAGRMDVNPEPFDPKALVATCCATVSPLLEEKPNVKLEYEVADNVGQANTDQGRIRQMLINLLSNAIKFTDEGEVKVTVASHGSRVKNLVHRRRVADSRLETRD